jgi:hypothetical protein
MATGDYDIRFAMVPVWLIDSGASATAVQLFAALGKFANSGKAWPSRKLLAEMLAMSPSTLDRAFRELREKGAISTIERRRPNGSRTTNQHTLHIAQPSPVDALRLPAPLVTGDEGGLVMGDEGAYSPVTRPELYNSELEPKSVCAKTSPNEVIAAFKRIWEERYHEKYVCLGPKDMGIAKRLLASLPMSEIGERMNRFIQSNGRFIVQSKHSMGVFAATINEWCKASAEPSLPNIEDIIKGYEASDGDA